MSYGGWSVGDIIQGIRLAWGIYEAVGVGMRSARSEFAAFRAEFNLIKCALERLEEFEKNCGEDLDLGKGYEQTLSRCADFIEKHKSLSKEAEIPSSEESTRRPSLGERMFSVWDRVSWPLEREEAEKLRVSLDRYVQIAILKVTSNTRDVTRQLARDSEQARVDHLEILRAVKTMSVQVSSILKRCLPDGAPNDPTPDAKYLARLQRRHLSSLLDPLPGLNAIPEDDVLSQSDSQAALQRIQDITDRLGHLALRLDTIGRQMTPSPERITERIQPVKRTNTNDSIGSDTTIVAPVVDLLNQIGDEVREALDKVGYEHVVIPGQQQPGLHGKSAKVLNNAVDDWDQFKDWLQFQLVHSLQVPSERLDQNPPSPELHPLSRTPPYGSSPPASSYLTPSPRWVPQDHLAILSRPPSLDLNYPQSPSPSSVDSSSWDRRSSLQSLPLTHHPVKVLFPDKQNPKSSLHRPVTCQLSVYLHPRTNEPDLIQGTDPETGIKLTHSLKRDRASRNTETSMTPYIRHSRHSSPLSITFMGSHRLKLEQDSKVHRWHISPVYICQDQHDFDMFQSTLLRRNVLFCGDVTCIQTSSMVEHCSQETVRVLQDSITGSISILYFASNRGPQPQSTLKGFLDLPVTDFSLPQKAGKPHLKLPLQRPQRDGFGFGFGGPLLRRNSVESSITTLSQESRTSRGSSAVSFSSCSDSPWKKDEKWVQFCFESDRGAEAFLKALRGQSAEGV